MRSTVSLASAVDPAELSRASNQVAFVNRIDASGAVAAQDRKDIEWGLGGKE